MPKKVLVIGATGLMGKRIVGLAQRLLPNVEILKASRKIPKNDPTCRTIEIFDQRSLQQALIDVNVVINTVGPFYYDPTLLLTECFNQGSHYIDLAETKEFIDKVNELANQANNTSSYVLSGCSTLPGLTDVFAQDLSNDTSLAKIEAFLSVGSSNKISSTLIYSFLRPLGLNSPNNIKYFSKLVEKKFTNIGKRLYGNYLSTYDLSGINIVSKKIPLNFYVSFDKLFYSYLLFLLAKLTPLISDKYLMNLSKFFNLLTPVINSIGSPIGILLVEALTEKNEVLAKIEIRARQNGLNIPSLPTVWAAEKLLNNNFSFPNKVLTLDNLFNSREITDLLLKEGYDVYGNPTKSTK